MLQKIKQKKGFSLLELLLAIAIFSASAISVGYLIIEAVRATDSNNKKIVATLYAREGIEAVRSIKEIDGFSELTSNLGTKGLSFNEVTNTWSFSGSSDTPETGYTRILTLSAEGSYVKVISAVTFSGLGRPLSTSLTTYFSNW